MKKGSLSPPYLIYKIPNSYNIKNTLDQNEYLIIYLETCLVLKLYLPFLKILTKPLLMLKDGSYYLSLHLLPSIYALFFSANLL